MEEAYRPALAHHTPQAGNIARDLIKPGDGSSDYLTGNFARAESFDMAISFPKRDIGIHVFVDEAGDSGIKPASPQKPIKGSAWFILGAVAVNANKVDQVRSWCSAIKKKCEIDESRTLHFVKLNNEQRRLACDMLSKLPVRCFVFCSNKSNMRGYSNPRAAAVSAEKNYYYNSCVKYLLERITEFGLNYFTKVFSKPKNLAITFDKNELISIASLIHYLDTECRRIENGTAIHTRRPMKTSVMNSGAIRQDTDENCAGLQLADLVAGAFHSATENALNERAYDIEPAMALKRIVWTGSGPRKVFANNGVTLFPPYKSNQLTPKEKEVFVRYGYHLD